MWRLYVFALLHGAVIPPCIIWFIRQRLFSLVYFIFGFFSSFIDFVKVIRALLCAHVRSVASKLRQLSSGIVFRLVIVSIPSRSIRYRLCVI